MNSINYKITFNSKLNHSPIPRSEKTPQYMQIDYRIKMDAVPSISPCSSTVRVGCTEEGLTAYRFRVLSGLFCKRFQTRSVLKAI